MLKLTDISLVCFNLSVLFKKYTLKQCLSKYALIQFKKCTSVNVLFTYWNILTKFTFLVNVSILLKNTLLIMLIMV